MLLKINKSKFLLIVGLGGGVHSTEGFIVIIVVVVVKNTSVGEVLLGKHYITVVVATEMLTLRLEVQHV